MRKFILKRRNLLSPKFFLVIFGFVLLLNSCDCIFFCSGTIYDSNTKQPIDSVKCKPIPSGTIEFSDSLGRYSVSSGLMGCLFVPPKAKVKFSKTGYKTKTVKKNHGQVYLDKE